MRDPREERLRAVIRMSVVDGPGDIDEFLDGLSEPDRAFTIVQLVRGIVDVNSFEPPERNYAQEALAHPTIEAAEALLGGYLHRRKADDRTAEAAVDAVKSLGGLEALRSRASLVVRCADCRNMLIAHVTFHAAAPIVWCRGSDGEPVYSWVQGSKWGEIAHCRRREYPIAFGSDLAAALVAGKARRRTIRVSHARPDGPIQ